MPRQPAKLPKGIDRLPSGTYRARIFYDDAQHSVGTFDSLADARAALRIAKGEKARGTFVPPSIRRRVRKEAQRVQAAAGVTVEELFRDWTAWLVQLGRKRGTIYTYESRYRRHIAPAFGDKPVSEIDPEAVDDWHAALVSRHGPGVARGAYITLSAMFSYAAGRAKGQPRSFVPLIGESPVHTPGATRHERVRDGEDLVFTADQIAQLAGAMPARYKLAVQMSGTMALRIGELLELRRKDLEDLEGIWWVNVRRQVQARGSGLYVEEPKSSAGKRVLPAPPELRGALSDHLSAHVGYGPEALIFPRAECGEDWTHPNTLRRHFTAAVAAVGGDGSLIGATFHTLRHSALTDLGRRGATIAELQAFAGHASAEVVSRYQHATRNRLAALVGN